MARNKYERLYEEESTVREDIYKVARVLVRARRRAQGTARLPIPPQWLAESASA